ncbi:MAG: nucleotidyltransferase family protein [Nitrospira sp.]|nr:nucleotidyltransferase family protein [Nitrospira sp.]
MRAISSQGTSHSTTGSRRRLLRHMAVLRRQLPILQTKYHLRTLGVFGSYVRGTSRQGSDLDLLVEFTQTLSLFEFVELEQRLSRLLGVKVDLVMRDALKPLIGRRILKEVVGL